MMNKHLTFAFKKVLFSFCNIHARTRERERERERDRERESVCMCVLLKITLNVFYLNKRIII